MALKNVIRKTEFSYCPDFIKILNKSWFIIPINIKIFNMAFLTWFFQYLMGFVSIVLTYNLYIVVVGFLGVTILWLYFSQPSSGL